MLKRGEIVRVAEGKPGPAIVIQADVLETPERILVCPLTSQLLNAPLYRPTILPDEWNNLIVASQLMVDQIGTARLSRIDGTIGQLSDDDLLQLDTALALVFDIAR